MIFKVIRTLTNSGIYDITIVLGGESVGDFIRLLGDGSEFNANFNYVYQQGAGGIAEALYLTEKIVNGQKVAVILGDNIFEDTFKEEVEEFEVSMEYDCILFLKEVSEPQRFGVAELNEKEEIIRIEEKPTKPKSNLCVTGLYFYDEQIFKVIKQVIDEIGYSNRNELEITDVNNYYIKMGKTEAKKVGGFWSDAGTFKTLQRCNEFMSKYLNNNKN